MLPISEIPLRTCHLCNHGFPKSCDGEIAPLHQNSLLTFFTVYTIFTDVSETYKQSIKLIEKQCLKLNFWLGHPENLPPLIYFNFCCPGANLTGPDQFQNGSPLRQWTTISFKHCKSQYSGSINITQLVEDRKELKYRKTYLRPLNGFFCRPMSPARKTYFMQKVRQVLPSVLLISKCELTPPGQGIMGICISKLSHHWFRQWLMACHPFGTKPLSEPMVVYCKLDTYEQISAFKLNYNK